MSTTDYQEVLDSNTGWVRNTFLLHRTIAQVKGDTGRFTIDTAQKFTDTTLGGNFAINPLTQYNGTTDPIIKGRHSASTGLGRYYSETFDDNMQLAHLRFGVPEYNSLLSFFTGFYNAQASKLARTGRDGGFFYGIGSAAGYVLSLPLAPFIAAGRIFRFFTNSPSSSFYYFKPAMPLYWNSVNIMFNSIMVNTGLVPWRASEEQQGIDDELKEGVPTSQDLKTYADKMNNNGSPIKIYEDDGTIDVYAVANRASRLLHAQVAKEREFMETAANREELRRKIEELSNTPLEDAKSRRTLLKALDEYSASVGGSDKAPQEGGNAQSMRASTAGTPTAAAQPVEDAETAETEEPGLLKQLGIGISNMAGEAVTGWAKDFVEFSEAELADGSAFVTFRCDHIDTVTESFSNSTGEPGIKSQLNSASSSAREARFNFANGSITGTVLDGAVKAIGDMAVGALDRVGMSGIAGLAGNAFVDIPDVWEDSIANMPTAELTIPLRSTYGHPIARAQKLILPLCMWLAAALPHTAGRSSYTEPFLVQYYIKGKNQSRLGIVDSLTIERGTGNVGWTKDGHPLGIDITVSLKDLSSIMHVPIDTGYSFNVIDDIFAEDTKFNDYMAVLGSLGLTDQIYLTKKLRLNVMRMTENLKDWVSPSRMANTLVGGTTGQMMTAFYRELPRG